MIDECNDDELDDMDTSPKSEKHEKINQGKSQSKSGDGQPRLCWDRMLQVKLMAWLVVNVCPKQSQTRRLFYLLTHRNPRQIKRHIKSFHGSSFLLSLRSRFKQIEKESSWGRLNDDEQPKRFRSDRKG